MRVVCRRVNELWKTLAEPHGNISFHVNGKWFKSLLQATYGKVTKTADILAQVDPGDLGQTQTAHWYEACS